MLTIGSLFSGIGGLELGLERAGLGPTLWQVECDVYCRNVLRRRWPDALLYEDVRNVGGSNLESADVVCGGFPCQGISVAGKRGGLSDPRSGLWREFARIVGEVRPGYVVVENSPRLARAGLDVVLADLAALGFDAVWFPLSAADVGSPQYGRHRRGRERVFVVGWHPSRLGSVAGNSRRR